MRRDQTQRKREIHHSGGGPRTRRRPTRWTRKVTVNATVYRGGAGVFGLVTERNRTPLGSTDPATHCPDRESVRRPVRGRAHPAATARAGGATAYTCLPGHIPSLHAVRARRSIRFDSPRRGRAPSRVSSPRDSRHTAPFAGSLHCRGRRSASHASLSRNQTHMCVWPCRLILALKISDLITDSADQRRHPIAACTKRNKRTRGEGHSHAIL